MVKEKDDQVAAPPLSNITLEQARELRFEITRLNTELYQAKTELRRTQAELDQKQKVIEDNRKTQESNRLHNAEFKERMQEELLATRERNIVLRNRLLTIQRATWDMFDHQG